LPLHDDLKQLPGLTLDAGDEPVFAEPWQAQAFAITVKLNEQGLFTWTEWAEVFGAEIAAARPDDAADNYYSHWLAALENIVEAKGALSRDERLARKDAWERAANATPHGQPIELGAELKGHSH
jgi:nitrile hydratase accessory protein